MSNDTSKLITPGIKFTGEDGKQYETTGEYRSPIKGEAFWSFNFHRVWIAARDYGNDRPILRELPPPTKPRRVPTDADAIHRPRCWVRNNEEHEWSGPMRLVAVISESEFQFKIVNSSGYVIAWKYCEIENVDYRPEYER